MKQLLNLFKKKNMQKPITSYTKIFISVIFLILVSHKSFAQPNTLFFMSDIHQSGYLNPAFTGNCNGFLSLPAISGIYLNTNNSGFKYNDLIHFGTGEQKDSLVIDIDNTKAKLGKNNYLVTQTFVPILGIGFWVKDSYITFEITNKIQLNTFYPEGLPGLLDGNADHIGENNPLVIEGFGPDLQTYNEFSFGWAKRITHRLTIGAKLKFLDGIACVQNKSSNIKLYTADTTYAMRLVTDVKFNISAPVDFTFDDKGLISGIDYNTSNLVSDLTPTKNLGLGLDLGAIYQFNDKLKFYASVTDLGFIRWDDKSLELKQSGTFEFNGLSLDSVWSNSDYDELKAIGDSLSNFFHFEHQDTKFTSMLNTNLYLGASYQIIPAIKFGFLSKTFLINESVHQAFTVSANFKPLKVFSASISYSVMSREYKNLGLGFALNLGPVQLYMLTDNIYAAFVPKNTKTFGLLAGLNLNFGTSRRDNFSMLNSNYPDKETDFM